MQSIFSNALSGAVAKHIDLSATRRATLSWLALLIMQHGTISMWRLFLSSCQITAARDNATSSILSRTRKRKPR